MSMNEIRKEKLRIVNLVDEINERGIALLSQEASAIGYPFRVLEWTLNDRNETGLEIVKSWDVTESKMHPQLRKIRHDLEQMLKAGKAQAMEVAA